jgi:hypothetical protein
MSSRTVSPSLWIALAAAVVGTGVAHPRAGSRDVQQPTSPSREGVASPTRDPVVVRGCLEGRWFRILEHDITALSGVTRVRLKGAKSMLTVLGDQKGDYVEVTGDLDLGSRDRLETRRKAKVGNKTTVSIGADAEQIHGTPAVVPEATLVVDAFTVLGERCPRH